MIVDNAWPEDWKGETNGKPRYEDIVTYGQSWGYKLSRSAVGRYGMRLRSITKMKNAGLVVKDIMKDVDKDSITETQKAAAQIITAQLIDLVANAEEMTSKEIKEVSQGIHHVTSSLVLSDKHLAKQMTEKVAKAAEKTKDALGKSGVDRKKVQEIIDEILGITKS